jgi:hypothetical protein
MRSRPVPRAQYTHRRILRARTAKGVPSAACLFHRGDSSKHELPERLALSNVIRMSQGEPRRFCSLPAQPSAARPSHRPNSAARQRNPCRISAIQRPFIRREDKKLLITGKPAPKPAYPLLSSRLRHRCHPERSAAESKDLHFPFLPGCPTLAAYLFLPLGWESSISTALLLRSDSRPPSSSA